MTWLRFYLDRTEPRISGSELARRLGTTRQTVSALLRGDIVMSLEWAEKIAPELGVDPQRLLFGPQAHKGDALVLSIPVRGTVAAGVWLEHDMQQSEINGEQHQVPSIASPYGRDVQFAYKVEGPSMDLRRIHAGDYVICVPYWTARTAPGSGDIAVIERTRGQLTERTVKEVRLNGEKLVLLSHSSDPRFNTPLLCERMDDLARCDDGSSVEFVGLVIGRYAPL